MLPGSVRRVKVVITDKETGAYVDPSTLIIRIEAPDGTVTELVYPGNVAIIRTAVGRYYTDVIIPNATTAVGQWEARWHGTGSNEGSGETAWLVDKSRLVVP